MPERDATDEEVAGLSRAYLARVHDEPVPPGLEHRAVAFAFSRGRTRLGVRILGATAIVLISALTAVGVLAFHHQADSGVPGVGSAQSQLRIVRIPGKLVLPALERTINDSATIARLAADIRGLPPIPRDERCAASFGLLYSLTFTSAGASPWTATIQAQGCEVVQVAGQPLQWAAHSPQVWTDLATALGLRVDQLQPAVCLYPGARNCVPLVTDPTPPTG
jgi:hypothetical protein